MPGPLLPGILFTIQVVDHSNSCVGQWSYDQTGTNGLVGLINNNEAFHRSWYGGAQAIYSSNCAGVAHAVLTAYGTTSTARAMLQQGKYRFTLNNNVSNLPNNLDSNNAYILSSARAQVRDGEFISINNISAASDASKWLTYNGANTTPYNTPASQSILPQTMPTPSGQNVIVGDRVKLFTSAMHGRQLQNDSTPSMSGGMKAVFLSKTPLIFPNHGDPAYDGMVESMSFDLDIEENINSSWVSLGTLPKVLRGTGRLYSVDGNNSANIYDDSQNGLFYYDSSPTSFVIVEPNAGFYDSGSVITRLLWDPSTALWESDVIKGNIYVQKQDPSAINFNSLGPCNFYVPGSKLRNNSWSYYQLSSAGTADANYPDYFPDSIHHMYADDVNGDRWTCSPSGNANHVNIPENFLIYDILNGAQVNANDRGTTVIPSYQHHLVYASLLQGSTCQYRWTTGMQNGDPADTIWYGGYNDGVPVTNNNLWDNPFSYGIMSSNDAGLCDWNRDIWFLDPRKFAFTYESLVDPNQQVTQHDGGADGWLYNLNASTQDREKEYAGITFYTYNCPGCPSEQEYNSAIILDCFSPAFDGSGLVCDSSNTNWNNNFVPGYQEASYTFSLANTTFGSTFEVYPDNGSGGWSGGITMGTLNSSGTFTLDHTNISGLTNSVMGNEQLIIHFVDLASGCVHTIDVINPYFFEISCIDPVLIPGVVCSLAGSPSSNVPPRFDIPAGFLENLGEGNTIDRDNSEGGGAWNTVGFGDDTCGEYVVSIDYYAQQQIPSGPANWFLGNETLTVNSANYPLTTVGGEFGCINCSYGYQYAIMAQITVTEANTCTDWCSSPYTATLMITDFSGPITWDPNTVTSDITITHTETPSYCDYMSGELTFDWSTNTSSPGPYKVVLVGGWFGTGFDFLGPHGAAGMSFPNAVTNQGIWTDLEAGGYIISNSTTNTSFDSSTVGGLPWTHPNATCSNDYQVSYTLNITDLSNGCDYSYQVGDFSNSSLMLETSQVIPGPLVQATQSTGCGAADGTITITFDACPPQDCGTYGFQISDSSGNIVSSTNSATNLIAGTYTYIISATNCNGENCSLGGSVTVINGGNNNTWTGVTVASTDSGDCDPDGNGYTCHGTVTLDITSEPTLLDGTATWELFAGTGAPAFSSNPAYGTSGLGQQFTIPMGSSYHKVVKDLCVDNVPPGNYSFEIINNAGCVQTFPFTIGQYIAPHTMPDATQACIGCGVVNKANMYTAHVMSNGNQMTTPVTYDTTNTNLVSPGIVVGHALSTDGTAGIGYRPGAFTHTVLMNRCCVQSVQNVQDGQYPLFQVPFFLSYTDHLGNDQNIGVTYIQGPDITIPYGGVSTHNVGPIAGIRSQSLRASTLPPLSTTPDPGTSISSIIDAQGNNLDWSDPYYQGDPNTGIGIEMRWDYFPGFIPASTNTCTITAGTPTIGSTGAGGVFPSANFVGFRYYLATGNYHPLSGSTFVTSNSLTPVFQNNLSQGITYYISSREIFSTDPLDLNNPAKWYFGCVVTDSTLLFSVGGNISATVITDVMTCSDPNPDLTVNSITGGTPPYTITVVDPSGATTLAPTTLTSPLPSTVSGAFPSGDGTYTWTIMDGNGCEVIGTVDMLAFTGPTIPDPLVVTQASCSTPQNADGSVTSLGAVGGNPTYTYQWYFNGTTNSNVGGTAAVGTGATSLSYTAALPGYYYLVGIDSLGCIATSDAEEVTIATCGLGISYVKNDETCIGTNDAQIAVTVGAGVPNYTFVWTATNGYTATDGPASTTTYTKTSLAVGDYTITITDSLGQVDSVVVTINPTSDTVEDLALTQYPPSCSGGCDGEIHTKITSGDFDLQIRISTVYSGSGDLLGPNYVTVQGGPFTSLQTGPGTGYVLNDTINHSGSSNFHSTSGVTAFCFVENITYHVQTVGINGCLSDVVSITLGQHVPIPIVITETLTQPTCCGCTQQGCATCNCNGEIDIVVTGGNSPTSVPYSAWVLTFTPLGGSPTIITGDFTNLGASSGIFEFSAITNTNPGSVGLYPGTYVFEITDGCGVTATETYILDDPRVYIDSIITNDVTCANGCADGEIAITASGGDSGTYQYSIDYGLTWEPAVPTASTTYTFIGVLPGTHDVWVRDGSSCGSASYFDPNDVSLCSSGCNHCYADYDQSLHQVTVTSASNLDASLISSMNVSSPGGSDGQLIATVAGGISPYNISIQTFTTATGYDTCTNQGLALPPGNNVDILLNGVVVDGSGVTDMSDNGMGGTVELGTAGELFITNLSVSADLGPSYLSAYYRIIITDAEGCLAVLGEDITNGLDNYISIYGAENCDCGCPSGYTLDAQGDCVGINYQDPTLVAPPYSIGTIQSFVLPNNIATSEVANYCTGVGSLTGSAWFTDSAQTAYVAPTTTGDPFYLTPVLHPTNIDTWAQYANSSIVLSPAVSWNAGAYYTTGTTGWSRLWDTGLFVGGQALASPPLPLDEWLDIFIEVDFLSPVSCVLAIAAQGEFRVQWDCADVITSEMPAAYVNPTATHYSKFTYLTYNFFSIVLPAGKHILKFSVMNNSFATFTSPAGLAFDLYQGSVGSVSTLNYIATAGVGANMSQYLINDINGVGISSENWIPGSSVYGTQGVVNSQTYGIFLSSQTAIAAVSGYDCDSGCLHMIDGDLKCVVDDTAECELPIDCPEYLSDLVECVGTLTNQLYSKLASGLLQNTLCISDIWKVILIKYLIKNLSSCITLQDLLSWASFLEDMCPDCEAALTDDVVDTSNNLQIGGENDFDF